MMDPVTEAHLYTQVSASCISDDSQLNISQCLPGRGEE